MEWGGLLGTRRNVLDSTRGSGGAPCFLLLSSPAPPHQRPPIHLRPPRIRAPRDLRHVSAPLTTPVRDSRLQLNLIIPKANFVVAWGVADPSVVSDGGAWAAHWRAFLDGDDAARNAQFKLIPTVVEGSWVIKQVVGSTPVLLGKKIPSYWYRSDKYLEISVDLMSSQAAMTSINLVRGCTKQLVIDLAIVLEGQTTETLPEHILGHIRLDRVDLAKTTPFDASREWTPTGLVVDKPESQVPPPRKD